MEPTKVYVDERDPLVSPNVLDQKEVVLKDGQKDRARVRRITPSFTVAARLTAIAMLR